MTFPPFRLSAADFTALARGGGGRSALRALRAARRSRTLLMIRSIAADPAARPAFALLCEVARVAPEAVDRVLDHPSVGAWATRTASAMRRGEPARPADLAFTAAAAAVRGGVEVDLAFTAAAVRGGVEVDLAFTAAAVRGGVEVSLEFPSVEVFSLPSLGVVTGPGLAYEPLPEIDLGGFSAQVDLWAGGGVPAELPVAPSVDLPWWRDAVGAAWRLLVRDHPAMASEVADVVSVLTPMPAARAGTRSATSADAYGCVFLSPMPDAEALAVTLVHEAQHSKLAALTDLFALVEPGREALFYAPWREDPRPAAGLLHGVYAHLGVAGFWRARPGPAAQAEYARWRSAALTAADRLLGSGKLTPTGTRFVAETAAVLRAWCAEPLPEAAVAKAAAEATAHLARWQATHS